MPPCLLGVRRGTGCICREPGSGASRGVCGVRTGPESRLRTEVRDWGPDPVPNPRVETLPWSSYRTVLHTGWWIRIFI
jgi:hypothetical protein